MDARSGEHLSDGVRRSGLARTGEADDAHDPAGAGRDLSHHRLLLGGERDPVGSLDLGEMPLGHSWRSRVDPSLEERQRCLLDLDELRGRVAGGPARTRPLTDGNDAVGRRESRREPTDPIARGSGVVSLGPRHHSFGIREGGPLLGQALGSEHPPRECQQLVC
jgi:hypothetical protein